MENSEIEQRKENFIKSIKENKNIISYVLLALIIGFATYIRTRNIKWFVDITTGKYLPGPEADTFVFLRYAQYIVEHGSLMAHDMMRYVPLGLDTKGEATLISYVIAYMYKLFHIFNPNITLGYTDVIYPVIFFAISLVFFFLLVRKIFDEKVALVACLFLTVVPGYLYRTIAGFSDKESLGMALMFATFYFYLCFFDSKDFKKIILFSLLSAFSTFLLALSWGGVSFVFVIIAGFTLFELFIEKFKDKNYIFGYWAYIIPLTLLLLIFSPERFTLGILITSLTSFGLYLALAISVIYYLIEHFNLFNIKTRFEHKLPLGLFSFIISLLLGLLIVLVLWPNTLFSELNSLLTLFVQPFTTSRWILTVAESHQPYFNPDWISQMGLSYLLLFSVGLIILFYNLIKPFGRRIKELIIICSLFIFSLFFSRYSSDSLLNGTSTISIVLYLGSLALFFGIIIYSYINSYYKDKNLHSKFSQINNNYIFVIIWFTFMAIGARSAIRLVFVLIPVATIMASFSIVYLVNYFKKYKNNQYGLWISAGIIIGVLFLVFIPFAQTTLNQAQYIGPMYNQQWQYAGAWVRNNTEPNSVFAHWWDYGYLVQTGFERPTITDGGNFIYAWNYYMGRNVLTGHSEQEALDFLYPHNTSYLLMVSDEIGKYPAYSSIGADENYDRYSWINTFNLQQDQIQETRDYINYVYTGGTVLDKDFNYNGVLLPKQIAGIAGFVVPINKNTTNSEAIFAQPTAVMVYNNQRYDVPVNCIYTNHQMYTFENKTGLDACLMLIPDINQQGQGNQLGSLLYISPEVKQTNFARLYLFNQDSENFTLVYNDEASMPLAILQGRGLIGPLKIWKISYLKSVLYNETYLSSYLDPKLMEV
ncbi:MAG: hypothetical protein KJ623_02790 [Nanoarchaeota archaeon]|nr:hypothetical protein [Nanoarchaeota archaeon]